MIQYQPIDLGSECDGRCQYCFECDRRDSPSVLRRPPEGRTAENSAFCFAGGNPLLSSDLESTVHRLAGLGASHIKLRSNCLALADPARARAIIDVGIRIFEIKIWGGKPDTHDRLAGTPEAYRTMLRATQNILRVPKTGTARQTTFVTWDMSLVEENIAEIPLLIDLALSKRVSRILLTRHPRLALSRDHLVKLARSLDIALQKQICVLCVGFPLCLLDEESVPHAVELYKENPTGLSTAQTSAACLGCALAGPSCCGWSAVDTIEQVLGAKPISPADPRWREALEFVRYIPATTRRME